MPTPEELAAQNQPAKPTDKTPEQLGEEKKAHHRASRDAKEARRSEERARISGANQAALQNPAPIGSGAPSTLDPRTAEEITPGELEPGESGFLQLDEFGAPTGEPTKEPPGPGIPFARVQSTAQAVYDEVVTITGAPITPLMNPSRPSMMDEAFLARNPPPESIQPLEEQPTERTTR